MNWTDEALMAFVDGELDAAQRADVERALAGDAVLQARVAKLQAQRRRVSAAYAPVLDEPVPDRLAALLAIAPSTPSATVVNLGEVRAERARRRSIPGWAQWGGMAASLVLGVLLACCSQAAVATPRSVCATAARCGAPIEQALSTATGQHERRASRRAAELRRPRWRLLPHLQHGCSRRRGLPPRWAMVVETLAAAEGKAGRRGASGGYRAARAVLDAVINASRGMRLTLSGNARRARALGSVGSRRDAARNASVPSRSSAFATARPETGQPREAKAIPQKALDGTASNCEPRRGREPTDPSRARAPGVPAQRQAHPRDALINSIEHRARQRGLAA